MVSLLQELLWVALGNRKELSTVPPTREWEALLIESQRQAIIGVLLGGIENLPEVQRPPQKVLLKWIGLIQVNENTYLLQCKRVRQLTKCLEAHGYRNCVLKGVGLAQLYPNSARRQCGDIDIWLSGDRNNIMMWLRRKFVVQKPVWHNVAVEFFEDTPVEVHFHPSWLWNPFYNKRLQNFFDQYLGVVSFHNNNGYYFPSVEFQAVVCLSHMYRHFIAEGIGLRHVVDYHYILRSLPTEEKALVVADLNCFGLLKFAKAMMWVLHEICGTPTDYLLCESDEKEGRFLQYEIMRGGNFGHYRKGKRSRNSINRMFAMLPHYPKEVLWMVPWKCWHKFWRMKNKLSI